MPYTWKTYPEALTNAGVTWQVYQEVDNDELQHAGNVHQLPELRRPVHALQERAADVRPGQFEYDAAHDRLPAVSWIIPTSYQSEHPDYLPAAGADFIASKIDAIAANPDVWAKTVFILNYDENDGLFDHVPPPTPRPARRRVRRSACPSAAASGCRASSSRRGRRAAGSPATPSTTPRCCASWS